MSERIDAELVSNALRSAYWQRCPASGLILHSDRGSQYASCRCREFQSVPHVDVDESARKRLG
jgi:putative transposase